MTTPRSKRTAYASKYAKLHRHGHRLTVDATVTRRMLQALRAIGYTLQEIADGAGFCDRRQVGGLINGNARGPRKSVYLHTAKRVESFYWAHYDEPTTATAGNKKAITYARKRRDPPPAAWDDIYDINEKPKGVLRK